METLENFNQFVDLKFAECSKCEEAGIGMKIRVVGDIKNCECERTALSWAGTYKFSAENDMSPSEIPLELDVLGTPTPMETMMLALVHPFNFISTKLTAHPTLDAGCQAVRILEPGIYIDYENIYGHLPLIFLGNVARMASVTLYSILDA
ncbi:hypothetical protein EV426DRAFT_596623 [Tirmania nivea]|nr:hypothetical protein EV426DRAFT_596623 [Tirmania nivea]